MTEEKGTQAMSDGRLISLPEDMAFINRTTAARLFAAAHTDKTDEIIRLINVGREAERQRAEAQPEPELDLSKWLHADGTARTRRGDVVEGLRRNDDNERYPIADTTDGQVRTWSTGGIFDIINPYPPLDLVPAYTHRYVISGTAFTVELWETGDGDDAWTHMVCTAIDERVSRMRQYYNEFRGAFWFVYLRGRIADNDANKFSRPGHHAHAIAIALHEALVAWDAELATPEPEKSAEVVNPLADASDDAVFAELKRRFDRFMKE
jgi:hypothetical protein